MVEETILSREQMIQLAERQLAMAIEGRVIRLRVEDQSQAGDTITVDGSELVNFGGCAYLGLNVDKRLKAGAIAAIERYGPVFSSSTAYTSIDLYTRLEEQLELIFGNTILVPTTTTLGHLSVLPILVGPRDLVLFDHFVHASVQLTAQVLRGIGATVRRVDHNDMESLTAMVEDSAAAYPRIWYLADGVYSMYGDTAPVGRILDLLDRHPNLHAYIDDAHGVGWKGVHGNGHVLGYAPLHERMIVIGSLAKSWGAGGAVLVLPNREIASHVLLAGATFTFSGPLHPAELGAAVAAAEIHLSTERDERAAELMRNIDFVRDRLVRLQLPALSLERTPLWFIRTGTPESAIELTKRMMADGFYVNAAGFPAVPRGMDGIRFTNTIYHTGAQLEAFMDALARNMPQVAGPREFYIDLR
jgi:7-keto-8-aminopelargonate synthetase-like enzyme